MASHYAPRKARFGPLKKIVLGILQFVLGLAVLLAALWGILALIAKHQSFVESYYQVQSDKLTSNVRVVQLSDLHLHEFGDHNAELIERITALKPDIIAITGDMNDKLVDDYSVVTDLCTELVKIAPVYYVPGNHEWPKIVFHNSPIWTDLEAIGVHFLADETETLEVHGNTSPSAAWPKHPLPTSGTPAHISKVLSSWMPSSCCWSTTRNIFWRTASSLTCRSIWRSAATPTAG